VHRRTPYAAAALVTLLLLGVPRSAHAQSSRVVDLATRPGVTERFLFMAPEHPKAAAILFTGDDGDVGIGDGGTIAHGGNFLVRTRAQFAQAGVAVAILDPPSDRRRAPYLSGFRQSSEHVADVRTVIGWLRNETHLPVWLIGTSRGTQSVAFVATALAPAPASGGPDGIVLTSTILVPSGPGDRAVPEMPLARIAMPVLVVNHQQDACPLCPYADVPNLMAKLTGAPRKQAIGVTGGTSIGDPCEAQAYHGYNGIENTVVKTIVDWILAS
jgi:hypothetical protein